MKSIKIKKTEFQKDVASHLRAFRLLFSYSWEWAVMGITILMDGLYPFINLYLSSMLLQALYEQKPLTEMVTWALCGAGTTLFVTITRHFAAKYKNTLWWGMRFRTEEPLMKKSMEMDYELLEDENVQKLRARQAEYWKHGGSTFETFIWQMELFLTDCLKLILSIIMLGTLLPRLLKAGSHSLLATKTIAISSIIVLSVGVLLMSKLHSWKSISRNRTYQRYADQDRLCTFLMSEIVLDKEAGKDIRLFHQKDLLEEYGIQMADCEQKLANEIARIHVRHDSLQSLWIAFLSAIAYLYTGMQAYTGSIPAGSIVRYAGAILQMTQAVSDIWASWYYLHNNRTRMDEFFTYLDLPDQMKKGAIPVQKRRDGRFLIEFRNVSFRYPGTETYVLRNMNLRFEIGERVALVGVNGSGKTTFVKLLCRLYDPTEGTILLNDVDIRKYRYDEYMRLFSVVFQDFQVFSFKMGEYIAGSSAFDPDKALDAANRAGLSGLLSKMPDGLNTLIGREFSEEGFLISGGEAQKLAMARAIYKDAPFVILDEPTAALDPMAEYEIYTRFHEIIGNKTALFISHRLSACRFAKEILVFEDGNIVQKGSHEELCRTAGLYQQMWQSQAQYYQ